MIALTSYETKTTIIMRAGNSGLSFFTSYHINIHMYVCIFEYLDAPCVIVKFVILYW